MNTVIKRTLQELVLGEVQTHGGLAVWPVLGAPDQSPEYLTLGAALSAGCLQVSETSASGSVPEIRVTNKADLPVLILDGEELVGAKQNRVANTSVLVPAHREIILDVSCTERGRWSYSSDRFLDSGIVMAHRVRRSKSASVSEGFRTHRRARSDQGEVWREIDHLHEAAGVQSPTDAMRDAFEAHQTSFEESLNAFPRVDGQRGLAVLLHGKVMGMDLLSRPAAYGEVHEKLVKSYVIDMLTGKKEESEAPAESLVRLFLEEVLEGSSEAYPSAGLGDDLRILSGKAAGSALVHEGACVHAALFARDTEASESRDEGPQMRGFRYRRQHRM